MNKKMNLLLHQLFNATWRRDTKYRCQPSTGNPLVGSTLVSVGQRQVIPVFAYCALIC